MSEENHPLSSERERVAQIFRELYADQEKNGRPNIPALVEATLAKVSDDELRERGREGWRQDIHTLAVRYDSLVFRADMDQTIQGTLFDETKPDRQPGPDKLRFEDEPGVPVTMDYGLSREDERTAAEVWFEIHVLAKNMKYLARLKKKNAQYRVRKARYGDLPAKELDRLDAMEQAHQAKNGTGNSQ